LQQKFFFALIDKVGFPEHREKNPPKSNHGKVEIWEEKRKFLASKMMTSLSKYG
jgi:hypothetical protein